jgi:hypothetical protein
MKKLLILAAALGLGLATLAHADDSPTAAAGDSTTAAAADTTTAGAAITPTATTSPTGN